MTDSAYFVKSTLTAFVGSFQNFAHILQTCGSLMLKKILFDKMAAILTLIVILRQLHLVKDSK